MKVRLFFKGFHHSYNKTVLAFWGGAESEKQPVITYEKDLKSGIRKHKL